MASTTVWVALGAGGEVAGIFTTELLASRHALANGGSVLPWPFGADRAGAERANTARLTKAEPRTEPRPPKVQPKPAGKTS